jgi:hypothetical protein
MRATTRSNHEENTMQGPMRSIAKLIPVLMLAGLAGCATIVGTPTQLIPIASEPADAEISIVDEKNNEVFKGRTPTTVNLPKSDGSYWGKKRYTVTMSKDGFESHSVTITASANGWYIAGNIIFGGLIGWFIVDPLNGDMYTLSPKEIKATVKAKTGEATQWKKGELSIMLIEQVPEELRGKMVRVQ